VVVILDTLNFLASHDCASEKLSLFGGIRWRQLAFFFFLLLF